MRIARIVLAVAVGVATVGVGVGAGVGVGVGVGTAFGSAGAAPGDPVRIMPLGASHTYGMNSSTGNGYRAELWRLLASAGISVDFVGSQQSGDLPDRDNEGHPGWRIEDIAGSVGGWLTTYRPDVVLLHVGTNDMKQNRDVARAPERLSALIDRILADAPTATVVASSLPPIPDAETNKRIDAFNAALPEIVQGKAAAGKRVFFADINAAVLTSDITDGTHVADAGYAKMGSVWHATLQTVLGAGRDWPLFHTGLEAGQTPTTWNDTVRAAVNVGGFCCGLNAMESSVRVERAHSGSGALMYSGNDTSTVQSYSYNRVFDVHLPVSRTTVLSYWIFPQQSNGTHVAVDLRFTDGSNLRDSGISDRAGIRVHPHLQGAGGHLVVNQWNLVEVDLAQLAGRTIDELHLGYDQPAGTGAFRGYVDDIRFVNRAA
jgi:lysophospholipase L1-like esterase